MRRALAAALALVGLAAAGCASGASDSSPGSNGGVQTGLNSQPKVGNYDGFGMIPPRPRPSFTLTDTSGKTYDFSARTRGKPTYLYFGYTRCPDVCPATMADLGTALRTSPASVSRKVTVVFVSTDPKHDTGPVIRQWIAHFARGTKGATFVGLRGTEVQIKAAQAAARIPIAQDGGRTHSAMVLFYGPDDYAHVSYANTSREEQQMHHDLPLVVGS